MAADSWVVCPAVVSVAVDGLNDTPVAGTSLDVTVTVQVAVKPSADTVMVAVPLATAVTTPPLMAATELLFVDQEASAAAVDTLLTTDNVADCPTVSASDDCDKASVGVMVEVLPVSSTVIPSDTMGESILQATAIQQAVTTQTRIRNILFFILLKF
jgi:hypothetical protein